MIGFIVLYTLTHFETVPQALWFSVLTSRILATGVSQSHCHLNWHMKSSCRSLIPWISSQSPWTVISRTRPSSNPSWLRFLLYNFGAHPTDNTVFYCHEYVFICLLPSNTCHSIVACWCVAGMYLESLPSKGYTRHITLLFMKFLLWLRCFSLWRHVLWYMVTSVREKSVTAIYR
jgi:hypothetical protein